MQNIIDFASPSESDKPWGNQEMEEDEVFDKTSRALNLLEFIVLLLTEDARHFKHG